MSKILVVEDDRYLLRDLNELLRKHQYEVCVASNVKEAMEFISGDSAIDLYLVDVWLPDGDGFYLCQQIRARNNKPVIFLTACDDEGSVIQGLDLGADDYVTKPFRITELLSRIRTNIRRQTRQTEREILCCGDIRLHPQSATVFLRDRALELRPVEYRLLYTFMKNEGRILSRDVLLEQLWDGVIDSIEDNTLTVHISRIRRKIGSQYIETIRGFGYRMTRPDRE